MGYVDSAKNLTKEYINSTVAATVTAVDHISNITPTGSVLLIVAIVAAMVVLLAHSPAVCNPGHSQASTPYNNTNKQNMFADNDHPLVDLAAVRTASKLLSTTQGRLLVGHPAPSPAVPEPP